MERCLQGNGLSWNLVHDIDDQGEKHHAIATACSRTASTRSKWFSSTAASAERNAGFATHRPHTKKWKSVPGRVAFDVQGDRSRAGQDAKILPSMTLVLVGWTWIARTRCRGTIAASRRRLSRVAAPGVLSEKVGRLRPATGAREALCEEDGRGKRDADTLLGFALLVRMRVNGGRWSLDEAYGDEM